MEANCPKCSHRIVIDDAKAPDRPFNVRCPKCQNPVRFPGKAAAAAQAPEAAPPPAAAPAPAAPQAAPPAGASADEMRVQMMTQLRREMSLGETSSGAGQKALVSLADQSQAGSITLCLSRQGYGVDTLEAGQDAARLLEQGVYAVVVTARTAAAGKGESLYQRANRLPPEARRGIFLILVGDEFKTGDGAQAFVTVSDLVVSSQDAGAIDTPFVNTLAERTRLYQAFTEAQKRHEASG